MVKCFDSPFGSYLVPESQLVVDMVSRYLAVINSSSNFIIYCLAGKQFRTVFAILLHLRSGQSVHNLTAVKYITKNKFNISLCLNLKYILRLRTHESYDSGGYVHFLRFLRKINIKNTSGTLRTTFKTLSSKYVIVRFCWWNIFIYFCFVVFLLHRASYTL